MQIRFNETQNEFRKKCNENMKTELYTKTQQIRIQSNLILQDEINKYKVKLDNDLKEGLTLLFILI